MSAPRMLFQAESTELSLPKFLRVLLEDLARSDPSYLTFVISMARRKPSTLVPRSCFPLTISSVEVDAVPYMSLSPSRVPTMS